MHNKETYPLVLISGLLSNESLWQHQLHYLREIAPISVFNPSQDSPDKMVEAILKTAPPKFAMAGHSMGGWLCLEILRVAPSRVSKVCLLNATARDDSQEKKAKRRLMIQRCEKGQFEEVARELASLFTQVHQVRKQVLDMFLTVGSETFLNQQKSMLLRKPRGSILAMVQCPALVIHAAQDKNFSMDEQLEFVTKIPNAKLAVVEESGHMSPLEMPQAITSLLRFWLSYF